MTQNLSPAKFLSQQGRWQLGIKRFTKSISRSGGSHPVKNKVGTPLIIVSHSQKQFLLGPIVLCHTNDFKMHFVTSSDLCL